jgi:rhodanese-related sulfurtransferase
MKEMKFLLYALFIMLFAVTACDNEDETPVDPVNEAEVLVKYLESSESPLGKDYVSSDMPSIMKATEVKTLNAAGKVYIIDIRSAEDFGKGHIKNAVNVPVGDILSHVEGINQSNYDKIAVVCYTGQTAGWATSILRLNGYAKAYSMKWGMCSWHDDFAGSWKNTVANGNAYASQFENTANAKTEKGEMPSLSTGETTGEAIFEARVAAVLAEGFGAAKVSNAEVFGNLNNYHIVNYWNESHYTDPGHIPQAMQYTPKESMKFEVDLTTLPKDKQIAVYCYTGQTSAFLAAYLRVLGYNAKSLLFGTNGMIYDKMVAKTGMTVFSESEIMGYEYEK